MSRQTVYINKLADTGTEEPVSLADARTWLKIDFGTEDDATITQLILSAREWAEEYIHKSIIRQQWRWSLLSPFNFSSDPETIRLPRGDIVSIEKVYVLDSSNVETVIPTAEYFIRDNTVVLKLVNFPEVVDQYSFNIDYTAGYLDAASTPAAIVLGIKELINYFYVRRGDNQKVGAETEDKYLKDAKTMLSKYKVPLI